MNNTLAWLCTDGSCGIEVTIAIFGAMILPYVIIGALILTFLYLFIKSFSKKADVSRKNRKILAVFVICLVIASLATLMVQPYDNWKHRQTEKNRKFEIYALNDQTIYTSKLKTYTENDIPRVFSTIGTEDNKMDLYEVQLDQNIKQILSNTENCGYEQIEDYIKYGKPSAPSSSKCLTVYKKDDRVLYRVTDSNESIGIIGSTVILFKDRSLSQGPDKYSQSTELTMINFIINATPATKDQLVK